MKDTSSNIYLHVVCALPLEMTRRPPVVIALIDVSDIPGHLTNNRVHKRFSDISTFCFDEVK